MQVDKIYDNRKPGLDPLQIYPPVIFHPSMYFTVFSGTYLGYRNKLSTDRCHFFQPVCYQTTNKQIIGSHLVQWNEKKIFTRLFTRQYQRQQLIFLCYIPLIQICNPLHTIKSISIESKFLLQKILPSPFKTKIFN